MSEDVVKEAREKMDKTVKALHHELAGIRTGRATASLLDVVDVDVYGQKMKINQLGTISVPDPNLIVVDLWDKSQLAQIEKAIQSSPLGVTPSNDGRVIRIPIPQLSEERRKELVKVAGKHVEDAKISIRNIRRHAIDALKKAQKDGDLPEDDAHRLVDEVQKITDKHVEEIDQTFESKKQDIMEV